MRRVATIFLVTALVGVVAFVLLGALRKSDDAFTLSVPAYGVVGEIPAGSTFCQDQIAVPVGGAFDGGRLPIGTEHRPGPRLKVTLEDARGRTIARSAIPSGFADNSSPRFRFDRTIEGGRGLRLCVTNDGDIPIFPYGSGGDPNPTTGFTLDGEEQPVDVALVFERPTHSTLATAGDIFARATLFRTPRLSGTLYGLLLLVLLGTAVAGVALALRNAGRVAESPAEGLEETMSTPPTETQGHRGGW